MTEFDLQKKLQERFLSLNAFSGISFLSDANVNLNGNKAFCIPDDRRWFSLRFMSDSPDEVGIGNNVQERLAGIYQIDICVPLGKGEDEAETKYKWIKRLFRAGTEIEELTITKVYKASAFVEKTYYRVVVRIEWTADIDTDD